jgi:parallel beta-helix repeat protein
VAFGETADPPITCGMTISNAGTFTLDSDLTCGTDDGQIIRIKSETGPVTLDLQGHTLSNTIISITNFGSQIPITIEQGTLEGGSLTATNAGTGCAPLTLKHLTINDSPRDGVKISGWCGFTIMGVVISNSAGDGVECEDSPQTTIGNSLISNNGGAGINLDIDCSSANVTNNSVTHNGGVGIAVYSSAMTVVTQNLVTWNDSDGISISGELIDGPTFYVTYQVGNNTTIGNEGYGIYAFLPVTDLGGDVARHNGATPQCVNVACVPG